jgi:hypothetical protein
MTLKRFTSGVSPGSNAAEKPRLAIAISRHVALHRRIAGPVAYVQRSSRGQLNRAKQYESTAHDRVVSERDQPHSANKGSAGLSG